MSVTSLDYSRITDLLIQQLGFDGHSLDNIPQAVFHIQAHGSDNNTLRLTHPGIPLFPTRALAIVGYNTYGVMSYCASDFNERVTINDDNGKSHSTTIHIKSDGASHVAIQLPLGETISVEEGKRIGLITSEIQMLNGGKIIQKLIGLDGRKISIEMALLVATSIYYSFIEDLRKKFPLNDVTIRQTLLKLQEIMYYKCGIRDFPNCRYRNMPGLYKDIYYVYEKSYTLSENLGENTVCDITTEQGTHMEVRMPTQISPYGLYIMYSTLKYLSKSPVRVPTTIPNNTDTIMYTINKIYEILFGSTPHYEGDPDICISQSNIMYNGENIAGTYTDKVPELFHNIIKLRLESDLFRALIPDNSVRNKIAEYWFLLADLDQHKRIPFSHLQFYLSYVLLLDVSIIDGSCRSSSTKSALIYPISSDESSRKSRTTRKSTSTSKPISDVRLLLQNKTADIISNVTTDRIDKEISRFRYSSTEEKLPSINKWINIFDKSSFQEMLDSLRRPWFNYTPVSINKSHLNNFFKSVINPEETKRAITRYNEAERNKEINESREEYIQFIERRINIKINDFIHDNSIENLQSNDIKELKRVILSMPLLDPMDISDEEMREIIYNVKNRGLSRLQRHREIRGSEYVDVSNPNPKLIKTETEGGGRYKLKKKSRRQKVTKKKRKSTHKQY